MKACPITTNGGKINSINLETGRFSFIDDLINVEKLNGAYVIK